MQKVFIAIFFIGDKEPIGIFLGTCIVLFIGIKVFVSIYAITAPKTHSKVKPADSPAPASWAVSPRPGRNILKLVGINHDF